MWPFKKKTRWQLEVTSSGPVPPGQFVDAALTASRIGPDDAGYSAMAFARIQSWGKKGVDPITPIGYGPAATEVATKLSWFDQEVLTGVRLGGCGDTMRMPFQVQLPIWAPPSMVGDLRILPTTSRPEMTLKLRDARAVAFDVQALPVHHKLFAATDSLGWKFAHGQLWESVWDDSAPDRNIELRLTFKPKGSFSAHGVTITTAQIVPTPASPTKAKARVTVFARKFPYGIFPIAEVIDVPLENGAAAWATTIRERLADEIGTYRLPDGTTPYTDFISWAVKNWAG